MQKKFLFCLVSTQKTSQKSWGSLRCFYGKCKKGFCVAFASDVVFTSELSNGCNVCLSIHSLYLLILGHKGSGAYLWRSIGEVLLSEG